MTFTHFDELPAASTRRTHIPDLAGAVNTLERFRLAVTLWRAIPAFVRI